MNIDQAENEIRVEMIVDTEDVEAIVDLRHLNSARKSIYDFLAQNSFERVLAKHRQSRSNTLGYCNFSSRLDITGVKAESTVPSSACIMSIVFVGEPGYPVAVVERGKRVIVAHNHDFLVADHDFTRFSLVPSVSLLTSLKKISGSWYHGRI